MPLSLFKCAAWMLPLLLVAGCAAEPAGPLAISDARIRALIPGQDTTAGYFDATNVSAAAVVLVGAESPAARAIEFHTTTRDGDVVRMRRLTEVRIEPGATIHFQPGGHHLMLFGVTSLDDETEIRLLTRDGTVVSTSFRQVPIRG